MYSIISSYLWRGARSGGRGGQRNQRPAIDRDGKRNRSARRPETFSKNRLKETLFENF
jgi:hypothetical protein